MNKYTPKTIQIPLTKGFITIIDSADADLLDFAWKADKNGYAYRMKGRNCIYMHRVILSRKLKRSLNSKEFCDHKDGNPTNNCRRNLRLTNYTGNNRNSRIRKNNTSGFKGIWKNGSGWRACIKVNGKKIYLGTWPTPEIAYKKYCAAVKQYHGRFGKLK